MAVEEEEICDCAFVEAMSLEAVRHVYRLSIVVHPGRTGRGVGTALCIRLPDGTGVDDVAMAWFPRHARGYGANSH